MNSPRGPQTTEAKIQFCQAIQEKLAEAIHAGDEAIMWRCVGWVADLKRALVEQLPPKRKG